MYLATPAYQSVLERKRSVRWIDALSSHGGSDKGAAAAGTPAGARAGGPAPGPSSRAVADGEIPVKALSFTNASSPLFSRTTSDEGNELFLISPPHAKPPQPSPGSAAADTPHERLSRLEPPTVGKLPAVTTARSSTCVVL